MAPSRRCTFQRICMAFMLVIPSVQITSIGIKGLEFNVSLELKCCLRETVQSIVNLLNSVNIICCYSELFRIMTCWCTVLTNLDFIQNIVGKLRCKWFFFQQRVGLVVKAYISNRTNSRHVINCRNILTFFLIRNKTFQQVEMQYMVYGNDNVYTQGPHHWLLMSVK